MKGCKILTAILSFLLLGIIIPSIVLWKKGIYLPWTETPGDSRTEKELINFCKSDLLQTVYLHFGDLEVSLDAAEFTMVDVDIVNYSYLSWLVGRTPIVSCARTFNSTIIDEKLAEIYKEHKDAFMYVEDGKLLLSKSIVGCDFDIITVRNVVIDYLRNKEYSIDLTDYCVFPSVYTDDLCESYEKLSWINDWSVSYKNGLIYDSSNLTKNLSEDFTLDIESLDLSDLIEQLNESYTTTHSVLPFTTSKGDSVVVPYSTYGKFIVDSDEEAFIREALSNHVSVTGRTPAMEGFDDIDGTYIEISIDDQHVWHYVAGTLCCETDCVTGRKGQHDTPTGVFYVSERISGKYLVGDGYRNWVNKWMRLSNDGIGLHDATWRKRFGGNIYEHNGSHGCINLPVNYAYKIFDEISRGTAVIVYQFMQVIL